MGAKLSRCDAPPAPPPLPSTNSPPPPPPDADEKGEAAAEKNDSISEAISSVSAYSNPGPWEAFNSECKRVVFLDTFDGAKVRGKLERKEEKRREERACRRKRGSLL